MEPQRQQQARQHPHLHNMLPPLSSQLPHRTADNTPISSPGLFSPSNSRSNSAFPSVPDSNNPTLSNSPYLHPLHKVRETHKALVDTDFTTGRKLINHYEIIEELGRGMHGKVKLARNLETNENVAIKIIPRYSKRRRLGKVTAMSTQDKSRREIAILKKIRHPNIVALLEVIDDPELKKIYMVLEHVELGEIVWRKKGLPHICSYERRRVEREMRGQNPTAEEERYELTLERRQAAKDAKRAKMTQTQSASTDYWSLEYGALDEEEAVDFHTRGLDDLPPSLPSNPSSLAGSRATSRAPSRSHSYRSLSRVGTPHPSDPEFQPLDNHDEVDFGATLRSNPISSTALDGSMYGAYDDPSFLGRSPSVPDSIISHMSSVDYNRPLDPYADDYSYVPCFTFEQARSAFRDTVLGLEYLHYEGVVHRDIKPANLLWTRDHRVKISDFGVSYFGRPIRDGEPDETISESEARDFDNDLELAKTVGTPAFFAPELCYTDALDEQPGQPQPKVTEQIDVWSLGVTLYCLIYARIPFLAEDEWQMFRKIAKEEVYIPSKRLRPVDPATKPLEKSLYTRINRPPYRHDHELLYEEVDEELRDLIQRMLTKSPEKRIKLRDVKRHAWVVRGIENVSAWLEETEPARQTAGRRIQVDAREMERAVVPLTFLERARSAVKKAVGKVIHRGDRAESASRKRASSSAASSAGETPGGNAPSTPHHVREGRRRSLRGDMRADDYFIGQRDPTVSTEHPLRSVTATPHDSPVYEESEKPETVTPRRAADVPPEPARTDTPPERPFRAASQKARHSHARSVSNAFLSLTPAFHESRTLPPTPSVDGAVDDPSQLLRKGRDMRDPADDTSRARSVDRGLFGSNDKRADSMVALSNAVAPGAIQSPHRFILPGSRDGSHERGTSSLQHPFPSSVMDTVVPDYLPSQQKLGSGIQEHEAASIITSSDRPTTAHRIEDVPEARTPPPREYNCSTPESFARAQEQMFRRQVLDFEEQVERSRIEETTAGRDIDPALVPCPPSPDDQIFMGRHSALTRDETVNSGPPSSSTSMGALATPFTSPGDTASPASPANHTVSRDYSEQILAFQSDPSLPALLSSTSSVSADLEGEFLGKPGVVPTTSILDTSDSLTPPAATKEPVAGFPLEAQEQFDQGAVPVQLAANNGIPHRPHMGRGTRSFENDDDSDSDEGLTMPKSRKVQQQPSDASMLDGHGPKRRDTNASIQSTDTAKKLVFQGD
ncbi:hypothetical protein VTK73DRAFT_5929 [Phialemonium thermophilum]|uniref:Protein kinase domain-containing protein n=1 Tax=Phialemonium thermophilum TaxID=223376 RepID=A0ABR3WLH9_9PEZI